VEIEWLEELESRVRDAVARLGEVREENRALRERVHDLEAALAARTDTGWEAERDEVRRRVEALTARLAGLGEE
jgi:hypothetical protein